MNPPLLCVLKATLVFSVFTGNAYAVNNNPATIEHVENAIEKALKAAIYTPGTAIKIVNNQISGDYVAGTGIEINKGVISANGQIKPYTGTGAIEVDSSTNIIESNFRGLAGIVVDNDAATITGYTGSNGVTVNGSVVEGNYQGAEGITVSGNTITGYTGSNGVTVNGSVVEGNYQGAEGITVSGNTITGYTGSNGVTVNGSVVEGAYQGAAGITVSGGTITGYTAGAGIDITDSTISLANSKAIVIGDVLGGGVVVYVDPSQTYGLVLATTDQAVGKVKYSANPNEYANETGLGGGLINTAVLLARITTDDGTDTAAFYTSIWFARNDGSQASNCTTPITEETTCYGGWFLPAIYEWQYVTTNIVTINEALRTAVGGTELNNDLYWSSTGNYATGSDSTRAYVINPNDASTISIRTITNADGYVRAMRKFYI